MSGYRIDLDICITGATVLHGADLHGQLPWLGNGYRTSSFGEKSVVGLTTTRARISRVGVG